MIALPSIPLINNGTSLSEYALSYGRKRHPLCPAVFLDPTKSPASRSAAQNWWAYLKPLGWKYSNRDQIFASYQRLSVWGARHDEKIGFNALRCWHQPFIQPYRAHTDSHIPRSNLVRFFPSRRVTVRPSIPLNTQDFAFIRVLSGLVLLFGRACPPTNSMRIYNIREASIRWCQHICQKSTRWRHWSC